jgi:hypothetical protein
MSASLCLYEGEASDPPHLHDLVFLHYVFALFVPLCGVIGFQVDPSEWRVAPFAREVGDRMHTAEEHLLLTLSELDVDTIE